MGDWYIVIKTIKGRRYRYRQRTWREGSRVRTESFSLGPVDSASASSQNEKATTNLTDRLATSVADVFAALQRADEAAPVWVKPWDFNRKEQERIEKVLSIDAIISANAPKLRSARDGAFYSWGRDTITMPPRGCFISDGATPATMGYYSTFLHELAHWAGHESRTGRLLRGGNMLELPNRAREELVAEATSLIVLDALGYRPENLSRHIRYFQHWLEQTDNKTEALAYSKREAEVAARYILSKGVNTTSSDVL